MGGHRPQEKDGNGRPSIGKHPKTGKISDRITNCPILLLTAVWTMGTGWMTFYFVHPHACFYRPWRLQAGPFGGSGDSGWADMGQWPVLAGLFPGVDAVSVLVRLIGFAAVLFGLGLAGGALLTESGELQVLFGVFALGGFLIALVGGIIMFIGALFRRNTAQKTGPQLTPEQQQRRDSQEFLSTQQDDD